MIEGLKDAEGSFEFFNLTPCFTFSVKRLGLLGYKKLKVKTKKLYCCEWEWKKKKWGNENLKNKYSTLYRLIKD
jgi:hypothetical protein